MSVVKKQTVSLGWLNSAANANTLSAGDFYVVDRDGTYQATSGGRFVKVEQAELPTFGTAAFAEVSDFATAAQGAKADSALQEVKTINGQSIVGAGNIVISSDAPLWVSGTTYAAGKYVVSPLSSHLYMRRTAGAGATDPANNKTNWRLIGAGGIKSVQRGRVLVASTPTAVSIAAVDPASCVVDVSLMGFGTAGAAAAQNSLLDYSLTANALTITRGNVGNISYYFWQVTEYWS